MTDIPIQSDFESWRKVARSLLAAERPPGDVNFVEAERADELFPADVASFAIPANPRSAIRSAGVPRDFLEQARLAACFRDPNRWSLLYRILWRLTHGDPHLMEVIVDDDIYQLVRMAKSVRRDAHKMKAFVRFRRIETSDGERFIAWHRPDHLIVKHVAPFFADRFAPMHWSILTPDASVDWDTRQLTFGPGMPRSAAPTEDGLEEFWKTYYASIFNPARLNLTAMRAEMPKKHWSTMPEAALLPDLIHNAPARVEAMMKTQARNAAAPSTGSAADFIPPRLTLPQLRTAAETCHGCDLYCHATQTVFGQGPANATAMFIGEQPGDQEDLAGRPFVGPSGQLLDEALAAARIPRDQIYVTNAVKHFKFEPRGKRRIHAKPNAREVKACRPWLEAEIKLIKPEMIVCLGATAAQSLLGPQFRITQHRGEIIQSEWAPWLLATNHPAAIFRVPDPTLREQTREAFFADLKLAAEKLKV